MKSFFDLDPELVAQYRKDMETYIKDAEMMSPLRGLSEEELKRFVDMHLESQRHGIRSLYAVRAGAKQ